MRFCAELNFSLVDRWVDVLEFFFTISEPIAEELRTVCLLDPLLIKTLVAVVAEPPAEGLAIRPHAHEGRLRHPDQARNEPPSTSEHARQRSR